MNAKFKSVMAVAFLALSVTSHAITVGQFKNPSEEFLDCDKVNSDVRVACQLAQQIINQKLNDANIYLEENGVVYRVVDDQNIRVKDSCSRRTTITRNEYSLTLKNSARLKLSGNFLSEPAVFALKLPVRVYARFDGKDEFGHKPPLLSCTRYATDSYWGDAGLDVTGNFLAMLSLEPKFKMSPSGDYIFALKPIFDLQASVGDVRIQNFDIHGANGFLNILSSATSLSTDLTVAGETVLKGGSVQNSFVRLHESQIIGQAQSALLTDYALSNNGVVREIIDRTVDSYVKKSVADINKTLVGTTINAKQRIATALNLDATGQVYLVLGPDFREKPVTAEHIAIINPKPVCKNSNVLFATNICSQSIPGIMSQATQYCGGCGLVVNGSQSGCVTVRCGTGS
ncbi:MAG: hypothetical protein B0W54_14480 [Cellvibrio sp. 79]|nr:MAG: hypothetical protein B0W54_14480 [Cellvibrio sp. 79]